MEELVVVHCEDGSRYFHNERLAFDRFKYGGHGRHYNIDRHRVDLAEHV